MTTFDEISDLRNEYLSKIRTDGKALLEEEFKKVFETFPQIEKICWTQYTPYFMDGDPCEFSVNDIGFYLSAKPISANHIHIGYDSDVSEYEWEHGKKWDGPAHEIVQNASEEELNVVRNLLTGIRANEELMEYAFGDHAMVTVTKEGIEIEEYDHD